MERLLFRRGLGPVFAAVALFAPVLTLLPPDRPTAVGLTAAWLVTIVSVTLVWAAGRDERASWLDSVAPMLYLIAVVILRHIEGGASSGYSPLLLLPLAWVALTGDTRTLGMFVVGLVAVLGLPIIVAGDPLYPQSEWRRLALWLLVGPIVGAAVQDVVARLREANLGLEALVRTDPLTGLLNRRGYLEVAERELARARRTDEPLALAMLDLDHFKRFNDSHGHAQGDALLVGATRAWAEELREIDVLARWGGEEFVVVLPRCTAEVATRVLDRVRESTPMDQTCSIGVAMWNGEEGIEGLSQRADAALYQAKESGRDRVTVAT